MSLVTKYAEMWPRSRIRGIPGSKQGGQGVYVLYDGSFPVYVGKGNIRHQLRAARRSKRRGKFWNHFSCYLVPDTERCHDVEALLLRILPCYLRVLNRRRGKFRNAKSSKYIVVADLPSGQRAGY